MKAFSKTFDSLSSAREDKVLSCILCALSDDTQTYKWETITRIESHVHLRSSANSIFRHHYKWTNSSKNHSSDEMLENLGITKHITVDWSLITALIQGSCAVQEEGIAFSEVRREKLGVTIWDLPQKFKLYLKRQPQMIVQGVWWKLPKYSNNLNIFCRGKLFSIPHRWQGEFHPCAFKPASQLFDN